MARSSSSADWRPCASARYGSSRSSATWPAHPLHVTAHAPTSSSFSFFAIQSRWRERGGCACAGPRSVARRLVQYAPQESCPCSLFIPTAPRQSARHTALPCAISYLFSRHVQVHRSREIRSEDVQWVRQTDNGRV